MSLLVPVASGQVDSFSVVGTHPQAVNQSTVNGKVIATLKPWHGKLYMGYGDYGANTGPISVTSYDPQTGMFTEEYVANTEAIYIYRDINEKLYAPAIDRKGGGPGDYIMVDSTGVWREFNCTPITTHGFDMASLGGDDLWMAGSHGYAACLWRSSDAGATWEINRLDSARSGDPSDFGRYYFIAAFQDKIYVQARDYRGPLHPTSRIFDGIGWLAGPDLFPGSSSSLGWQPHVFNDMLVYRSWQPPSNASFFWSFNGMRAQRPDSLRVWDIFVDSSYVWTLAMKYDSSIVVQRSPDAESWELVTVAPRSSRSLAVMDRILYVGTKNSELLSYRLPVPSSIKSPPATDHAVLQAYPHPARSHITVSLPEYTGTIEVRITDMTGKSIRRTLLGNGSMMDVSGLRPGTYIMLYKAGGTVSQQKLIIR